MKDKLEQMIRQAQREVRRASGIPLSVEEKEQERREREIKALQTALLRELGLEIMIELLPEVGWDGRTAFARFTIDEVPFEMRRSQEGVYMLSTGDGGQELAHIAAKDTLLGQRFLAMIGDFMAEQQRLRQG